MAGQIRIMGLMFVSLLALAAGRSARGGSLDAEVLAASVGMVFYDDGERSGSVGAFCVDDAGIYLTSRSALWGVPIGGKVEVYLSPGQQNQRIVETILQASYPDLWLARLQAVDPNGHKAVPFGKNRVSKTPRITACYGSVSDPQKLADAPPKLKVQAYKQITKTRGRPLPPSTGAPVFDKNGLLIAGIGDKGDPSEESRTMFSDVEKIVTALAKPLVQVRLAPLNRGITPGKSFGFSIKVDLPKGSALHPNDLVVGLKVGRAQMVVASLTEGGEYRVVIARNDVLDRPPQLWAEVEVELKSGESVRGLTRGRESKNSRAAVPFDQIERITFGEKNLQIDRSGEAYPGPSSLSVATKNELISARDSDTREIRFGRVFAELEPEPLAFTVEIGSKKNTEIPQLVQGEILLASLNLFDHKNYLDGLGARGGWATPLKKGTEHPKPVSPKVAPVTVTLPAPLDDLSTCGDGRYIAIHFGSLKKIGLFDLASTDFVAFAPFDENKVSLIAGRDRVIGIGTETGKMTSWSLPDLKVQAERHLPDGSTLRSVSMGSDSSQAFAILHKGRNYYTVTINGADLSVEALELKLRNPRAPLQEKLGQSFQPYSVISSQSGNSFVALGGSGKVIANCRVSGRAADISLSGGDHHLRTTCATLSPDGNMVFTGGAGIFDARMEKAFDLDFLHIDKPTYLPSEHPGFYFSLARTYGDNSGEAGKPVFEGYIHDTQTRRPVGVLPDLSGSLVKPTKPGQEMAISHPAKRFILNPKYRTIVTMPSSLDRLILTPINAVAPDKWQHGILQVRSPLNLRARRGDKLTFQLDVVASDPPLRYLKPEKKLENFSVSADGKFSWLIPEDHRDPLHWIELRVVDAKHRVLPIRLRVDLD
ncbi:MAG: hypothetical protein ACI8XO_002324 [Verrucomicrobiales bacterium]|jgi:hypothetical protein